MRIGVSRPGEEQLSSRIAGRMISSLLRREPEGDLPDDRSSRSADRPRTYCGVTAVSSTTTPAALTPGPPAAAPTSSIEAAGGLRQQRDVVEQGNESTGHGQVLPVDRQ
jgi:hypothetical protein